MKTRAEEEMERGPPGVYMLACMHTCLSLFVCLYIYMRMDVCVPVCVLYLYGCMCVNNGCLYACMSVCLCQYVFVYLCIYIYVCMCIFIYGCGCMHMILFFVICVNNKHISLYLYLSISILFPPCFR